MARKRDRIFALTLAIVFFVTAFGFSFWVIWQMAHGSGSPSNTTAATTPTTPQKSCSVASIADSTTLPAPTIYKPTEPVQSLQTTDLTVGSGAAVKDGDCLVVKYYGTLAKDGTVFDENFDKPTALTFPLGGGQVIKGWDQGLVGVKVGGTRRLVIPATLGYGSQASGSIPANSDLVFVVQVLRLQ